MLFPLVIAVLALRQTPETWTLNPTFDPNASKEVWGILVEAFIEGEEHHATFEFSRQTHSTTPEKTLVTYGWQKLAIDDEEGQEISPWDASVGAHGEILKMEGRTEDDYRRMLSPMIFVYPNRAISVGDKWSVDVTPPGKAEKLTYEFEAKSKAIEAGVNTLVVYEKLTEGGKLPISGEGHWWLSKVGKIVKFEIKLSNWVVPMAGSKATDVTIKGLTL